MHSYPDQSRPDATHGDMADLPSDPHHHHTLTIEDVAQRYQDAGLPRTTRTLQRYAEAGHLAAQKIMTATGTKYLITPHSVDMHLTQLRQLDAQARLIATGRDLSRHDNSSNELDTAATAPTTVPRQDTTRRDLPQSVAAFGNADHSHRSDDAHRQTPPTPADLPRPVATPPQPTPADDRYLKLLERENEFLRDQVNKKDTQIEALTKLSESTVTNVSQQNTLLQGFQRLLGLGQKTEGRGVPADRDED